MSYPITHVVVKDKQPVRPVVTVGRMYQTSPDPVFKTENRADRIAELKAELEYLEDGDFEAETKVVRPRGRRPGAKANEAAETK